MRGVQRRPYLKQNTTNGSPLVFCTTSTRTANTLQGATSIKNCQHHRYQCNPRTVRPKLEAEFAYNVCQPAGRGSCSKPTDFRRSLFDVIKARSAWSLLGFAFVWLEVTFLSGIKELTNLKQPWNVLSKIHQARKVGLRMSKGGHCPLFDPQVFLWDVLTAFCSWEQRALFQDMMVGLVFQTTTAF